MSQLKLPNGWQVVKPHLIEENPQAPWPWILEAGSLTRLLQQSCSDNFNLKLLGETKVVVPNLEANLLNVAIGSRAKVREVYLLCGDVPCIYALSIIPESTLDAGGRYLDGLGVRPLGDALFTDPGLERGPVEVIMLEQESDYFTDALRYVTNGYEESIWGRRSVFRTGDSPLLVCEFFLPGLVSCLKTK